MESPSSWLMEPRPAPPPPPPLSLSSSRAIVTMPDTPRSSSSSERGNEFVPSRASQAIAPFVEAQAAADSGLGCIMSACVSIWADDMPSVGETMSNIVKTQKMSLVATRIVATRVAEVSHAVSQLAQRQMNVEDCVGQMETKIDAVAAVAAHAAAVASSAAAASSAPASSSSSSSSSSLQQRLLSLFKSTRYAYQSLRVVGDYEAWRRAPQQRALLPASKRQSYAPYGSIYARDGDTVVFSVQLFHQAAFVMFPGCKPATNDELVTLMENVDPGLVRDSRNSVYDIALQRRTHSIILRMRASLWDEAIAYARSFGVGAKGPSDFKSVYPPDKAQQRGIVERRTGNDYYAAAAATETNKNHLFTHAPWVDPKTWSTPERFVVYERARDAFCDKHGVARRNYVQLCERVQSSIDLGMKLQRNATSRECMKRLREQRRGGTTADSDSDYAADEDEDDDAPPPKKAKKAAPNKKPKPKPKPNPRPKRARAATRDWDEAEVLASGQVGLGGADDETLIPPPALISQDVLLAASFGVDGAIESATAEHAAWNARMEAEWSRQLRDTGEDNYDLSLASLFS